MPAFNLGYLLRAGGNALTGYRQGTREREARERQEQTEDAERMFTEWAKRRQFDQDDERLKQSAEQNRLTREALQSERDRQEANRKADNRRQRERDQTEARNKGWGDSDIEILGPETDAAQADLPLPTVGATAQGKPLAPQAPYRGRRIGNVDYNAPDAGPVEHQNVGGQIMRRDPQRAANEATRIREEEQQAALDRSKASAANRPERFLTPTPPSMVKAYIDNQTIAREIDETIAVLQEYPAALGAKTKLGNFFTQRIDPRGNKARAYISAIGGQKYHDLSGATVSPNEDERLRPSIPVGDDTIEGAIAKLTVLKEHAEMLNAQMAAYYNEDRDFRGLAGAVLPSKPSAKKDGAVPPGDVNARARAIVDSTYKSLTLPGRRP